MGPYQARPDKWGELARTQTWFQDRLEAGDARSSIRLQTATAPLGAVDQLPQMVDAGVAPIESQAPPEGSA